MLTEIHTAKKIYFSLLEQIEKKEIDPMDVDINAFLSNLSKDEDIKNSSYFVLFSSRLLKLKAEKLIEIITGQTTEKITKRHIEKVLIETASNLSSQSEEDILSLLMEESIVEKLRKPKFKVIKKISKEEFLKLTKSSIKETIFKNIDYNKYADDIYHRIKNNSFKIKSFYDFIGLMYAIYKYGLEIDDIKQFL